MLRPRLTAAAIALLCAAVAAPIALAAAKPTLPALFARQIHAIHRVSHAPAVLLPGSMPLDAKRMFATGGPDNAGYDLEIGAVRHCGEANACFVAAFTAVRGGQGVRQARHGQGGLARGL